MSDQDEKDLLDLNAPISHKAAIRISETLADLRAQLAAEREKVRQLEHDKKTAYGVADIHFKDWQAEREKVRTLTEERERIDARVRQLEADAEEVGAEDDRGHKLIDAADAEEMDSSSMDTLATRVEHVLKERDEARAQLKALEASRHALAMRVAERVRDACEMKFVVMHSQSILTADEAGDSLRNVDLAALVAECEASHG